MPTILLKKSDTPGSVPGTANLTNLAGGVEVAVNTADKRVYSMTSASAVIELGTNPSSLTCADVSATVFRSASATITNLIATSASITTLTNNPTFSAGTANGVLYLNGSKVATSGSALYFNGTQFGVGANAINAANTAEVTGDINTTWVASANRFVGMRFIDGSGYEIGMRAIESTRELRLLTKAADGTGLISFYTGATPTERMRLTTSTLYTDSSINVGIGTSSPATKLDTAGTVRSTTQTVPSSGTGAELYYDATNAGLRGYNRTGAAYVNLALNDNMYVGGGSSGNVGIGTSSPGQKLEVANTSGSVAATLRSSNSGYSELYFADVADSTAGALSYEHSTNLLRFYNGGSVRATLDSSGNLGLGVTPTNNTLGKTFQIGDRTTLVAQTGSPEAFWLGSNWYYNGGDKYLEDGYATLYSQQSGLHVWFNSPNNTSGTGNPISFTQAMTLDAAGRLLVGATAATAIDERLNVTGRGIVTQSAADTNRALIGTFGGSDFVVGTFDNFAMTFRTNNTERARITSGGYFKVQANTSYQNAAGSYNEFANATANEYVCWFRNAHSTNPFGVYIYYPNTSPNGTSSNFLTAIDSTALRAELRSNGGLANYQANNVDLSDARTKKDITPAASMWGKVAALEIVAYKYNDQTHDDVNLGVIAQQVEAVEPVWVDNDGWGDETPEDGVPLKTVYTKDITFAAIKALQEAMARIEQLEADMAALKASA